MAPFREKQTIKQDMYAAPTVFRQMPLACLQRTMCKVAKMCKKGISKLVSEATAGISILILK